MGRVEHEGNVLQAEIEGKSTWPVVALGFGAGLWVFALYVMAHLIAGLPPFLGFIQLTWASLVGHLIFGLVCGAVVRWRSGATG